MQQHAGVHAVGPGPDPRQPGSEDGKDRERLDESVPGAEGEPDADDRDRYAEAAKEREAEPAEGQLLDDRSHDGDREEVEREGARVPGLPVVRRVALLAPGVEVRV